MLKQTLAQRQQQNLSAQQIQQIKLLELPAIELEERIQKELEANPALEEGAYDDEVPGSADGTEDNLMRDDTSDLSLGDYRTEEDIPEYKLREIQDRNSRREEIPFSSAAPSINDRLVEQLKFLPLTDRQQQLAPYIIGNIEEDGYLHRDLEEILDDLAFRAGIEADQKEVEEVIGLVQSLDPPGICARDLKECLLLQLERLPDTTTRQTALHILTNHYDDFVSKRFEQLQEEASLSDSEMKEAFGLIMQLNPKPANGWGDDAEAAMNRVYPDFIVERMGDDLVVSLTRGGDIQPLRVSKVYQEMMQDYQGSAKNRSRKRKQTLRQAESGSGTMVHRGHSSASGNPTADDGGHSTATGCLFQKWRTCRSEAYDSERCGRSDGLRCQYDLSGEQQQICTDRLRNLLPEALFQRWHCQ